MKHYVSATKTKNKVVVIEISCAIEQNACDAYIWKAALLSIGLTVVLEVEEDASLSLSDGLTVVLEVEGDDSLSLSDGLTVVLEVEGDDSLPLSVGLTVVLEVEGDDSLSLSDGLAVVLEVDDVSLPVAEPLAVVLEVDGPFAELDELLGGRSPGLLGPLPALGHMVMTASSLGPADI